MCTPEEKWRIIISIKMLKLFRYNRHGDLTFRIYLMNFLKMLSTNSCKANETDNKMTFWMKVELYMPG